MARILLSNGANPNTEDYNGNSVLNLASAVKGII